ncbi:MAG: cysteine dioxygenase family protein [bacterium]
MTFDEKIRQIDHRFSDKENEIQGPSEFKLILEQFNFSIEDVRDHLLYPEALPYGRKCVFRSKNFEVVVMNWKPGNGSNIHDHGRSFGCVYSVTGKADNVLYNAALEEIGIIPLINNAIAEVPRGIYHVIKNDTDEYAVSLHFYAPPMDGMHVIDPNDKTRSWFVKNDCGAWDPGLTED